MLHQVDFAGAIGVPEIDSEHIERGVNFTDEGTVRRLPRKSRTRRSQNILDVDFLQCNRVAHNESNAWGRGDRSSILDGGQHEATSHMVKSETHLVTKATHPRTNGLLDDL